MDAIYQKQKTAQNACACFEDMQFRRAKAPDLPAFDDAADSLKLVLFASVDGVSRGWYIGPLIHIGDEFVLPFLPMEQNALAVVAVAQALQIADESGLSITLFDPESLWEEVWDA